MRNRLVWTLGLGAFGLAFSITTTSAYLAPLLERFTDSRTVISGIIAAEGIFALGMSLVIGPWSDSFHTPLGRRRPFMLVALPGLAGALALMGLMPNLWTTTVVVLAFYVAYYVYEPPYRGLYPDLLPERVYGRAQGVQHLFRGIALGGGLFREGRGQVSPRRAVGRQQRSQVAADPAAQRRGRIQWQQAKDTHEEKENRRFRAIAQVLAQGHAKSLSRMACSAASFSKRARTASAAIPVRCAGSMRTRSFSVVTSCTPLACARARNPARSSAW